MPRSDSKRAISPMQPCSGETIRFSLFRLPPVRASRSRPGGRCERLRPLEKHGQVRREFQDTITLNLRKTVIPCLDKLESSALTADQYQCVSLLRRRLSDIVSPFLRAAALLSIHLTQKEAQVADLIRQGKKTLEIASLLGCSKRAVEFHRDSLRKKLKIKNRKANLRQVLLKIGPCSEYV